MAHLFIDDLLANPNARVRLTGDFGPGGGADAVEAFIREPLSLQGNNDWSSPDVNSAQAALSYTVNAAMSALNSFFGTQVAQMQIKHLGQTIQAWTGSGKPVLNIPMQFIIVRDSDVSRVREDVKKLYRTVYPTTTGEWLTQRVIAPLGYTIDPKSARALAGTMILEIGQWFRATDLVMNNVNFNYAVEVVEEGFPVVVEGSIELQPFRALTADEFLRYFR